MLPLHGLQAPFVVTLGSPIYPTVGGGMLPPNKQTKAMWNAVHGASIAFSVLELGVNEDIISGWYRQKRLITGADALRRQRAIVFGGRGDKTVHIEADETVVRSFKVDGQLVWYFYVWLGIKERGNPCTLWLTPSGLKKSEGEGRVVQMQAAFWEDCMDQAFTEDTHGILHTDTALGFGRATNYQLSGKNHVGIEEHYKVNHSLKEWTRQEPRILQNWVTRETAAGTAGSQDIEKSWDLIKDKLPRHLSCRTEAGIAEIDEHVRDRCGDLIIYP